MIFDSRGISSGVPVLSLTEVERARFRVFPLVVPVRPIVIMQVYAIRIIISAAVSVLSEPLEIGILPRAEKEAFSLGKQD